MVCLPPNFPSNTFYLPGDKEVQNIGEKEFRTSTETLPFASLLCLSPRQVIQSEAADRRLPRSQSKHRTHVWGGLGHVVQESLVLWPCSGACYRRVWWKVKISAPSLRLVIRTWKVRLNIDFIVNVIVMIVKFQMRNFIARVSFTCTVDLAMKLTHHWK